MSRCYEMEEPELEAPADPPATSEPKAGPEISRRGFLKAATAVGAGVVAGLPQVARAQTAAAAAASKPVTMPITLSINGKTHQLTVDTRTTLLDLLRENLELTGSKKGCDHGQCGACTVLMNGCRINSCLMLAAAAQGAEIITIEGLEHDGKLHPVQQAFLDHDGFQCGYCTSGQICSAVGMLHEAKQSAATFTDADIRERMSGNICRCGAYPNIVAAVRAVQSMSGAGAL